MSQDPRQSAANAPDFSSLPRLPRPGPESLRARLAAASDEDAVGDLLESLTAGERPAPDPDRLRWATQTLLRKPVHGFIALAERPGDEPRIAALAVVSVFLDPVRGWSGELSRLWIAPELRETPGLQAWFLEESLEMARYRGVNRVQLPGSLRDRLPVWDDRPPSWLELEGGWALLRPHFDEPET